MEQVENTNECLTSSSLHLTPPRSLSGAHFSSSFSRFLMRSPVLRVRGVYSSGAETTLTAVAPINKPVSTATYSGHIPACGPSTLVLLYSFI